MLKKIAIFLLGVISAILVYFKIKSKPVSTLTKEIEKSKEKANEIREDIQTQKANIEETKSDIEETKTEIQNIKKRHNRFKEAKRLKLLELQKKKEEIQNATTGENLDYVNEKYKNS